jgi:hypothetical protein
MKGPRLIVTNIRLPKEELLEYRSAALDSGKSLSAYVRDVMRAYASTYKKRGREPVRP